jgi:excisionase family DNA binding protein
VEQAQTERTERPRGRLLRVPEVAERLRVGKSTVYELIAKGALPAIQLRGRGSTVRVDENELERWLKDGWAE